MDEGPEPLPEWLTKENEPQYRSDAWRAVEMPGLGLFLTGDEVPDEETTEQEEKAAEEGDVERPQGTQREAVAAVVDELVGLHEKDSAKFKPAVTKASLEKKASFNKVSYARTHNTHKSPAVGPHTAQ